MDFATDTERERYRFVRSILHGWTDCIPEFHLDFDKAWTAWQGGEIGPCGEPGHWGGECKCADIAEFMEYLDSEATDG